MVSNEAYKIDSVKTALYSFSVLCLFLITIILITQITFRLIGQPIRGIGTLAQIIHAWLVFLVLGNLEIDGRHIEVDYFAHKFSERTQLLLGVFRHLLILFASGFLLVAASLAVLEFFEHTTPIGVPYPIIHAAPLIGVILLGVSGLIRLRSEIGSIRRRSTDG